MKTINRLIQNVVSDYRSYVNSQVAPRITDLDHAEKKLILFHLSDEEEYARALTNPVSFNALVKEYADYVNPLLDEEFDEQYIGALREHGLRPHTDQINGETRWY